MATANADGSIVLKTKIDESGAKSGFSNLKSGALKVGKALGAMGVAGATAVAAITKKAVESYAEYEQLAGGVETLFKDSADVLMGYADKAYQTAGLSANAYMETVTSFSASLLQSLGGDTAKSADYANQAIIDMSDNANKMGTSMEMIQNAYQGFAKQNYTMLDNLKLGYGGTKEEMQRLLDDAEKISGIEYDISSFADVTQAIHIMQMELGISGYSADELKEKLSNMSLTTDEIKKVAQDMGISYEEAMTKMKDGTLTVKDAQVLLGTTAKEASTTIQGSASAMKASWENLLVGMADESMDFDALLKNFIESVGTFAENLVPRIKVALGGIIELISSVAPMLVKELPTLLQELLPMALTAIIDIVMAISEVLPSLLKTVITSLVSVLPTLIPQLVTAITQLFVLLLQNIDDIIMPIISAIPSIINSLIDALLANFPLILDAYIQLFSALVDAIPTIIPIITEALPQIINSIVDALLANFPLLLDSSIQLFLALVSAIPEIIPQLITALSQIVGIIVVNLVSKIPKLFGSIWDSLVSIFSAVPQFFASVFKNAVEFIKLPFRTIIGFFKGVWQGIKNVFSKVGSSIGDAIKGAVSSAVNKVLSGATRIINGFISSINVAVGVINAIPGVNIKKINQLSVPKLAKGAVIPGGKPFLAMLGDQPSGQTNIEAPLDTIVDAVRIALGGSGGFNGRVEVPIYLDSRQIAVAIRDAENNLGTQTVTGGFANAY